MKDKTTVANKNIKSVIIALMIVATAIIIMAVGTNAFTEASNSKGNKFVGENRLTLTDQFFAHDGALEPDTRDRSSYNDAYWDSTTWWVSQKELEKYWKVNLHGYTKEAYFDVRVPIKKVIRFSRDTHYDIEGVYHRFVKSKEDCKIPEVKPRSITRFMKPIHIRARDTRISPDGYTYRLSTDKISTKDRFEGYKGSCVIVQTRERLGVNAGTVTSLGLYGKDVTIYTSHYVTYE